MSGANQIAGGEAPMKVRWADVESGAQWAMFPREIIAVRLGKTASAGVVPFGAMPVGRVLVKTVGRSYGPNSFLSTDALFTRWDGINGQAWSQDRKATPAIAPVGSGAPATGGSGRTPDTRAFEEGRDIFFMGPVEHKWRNPYGITVRGAGLGIKSALNDNFFFSGDHYHASHHRGINVPLGSTRIYDFRRAKPDEEGSPVGMPDEGMAAGLDTMTIVVPQADGNAGGERDLNTLAANFSGDTGPGFGAAAFKIDAETVTDGRLRMIIGYRSYEKFGPFSGGSRKNDKHLEGINREGNPVQVAHIHIGAKLTDDSVFYDGRQHIDPVIEPPVGGGGMPVRTFNQFRPGYVDSYFFDPLLGVYDYWTAIPRGMVTIDPTPNKQGDPTPNKDGDPTPLKQGDPRDPTPNKPPPTMRRPPITGEPRDPGEFPGAATVPDRDEGAPDPDQGDPEDGPGAATVPEPELPGDWHGPPKWDPPAEPPTDWGPSEIATPSIEFQPMLGNTAPPVPARLHANSVDPVSGRHIALGPDGMPTDARTRADAMTLEERIDNLTVDITGATLSDHFKAPFTGHFEAYYKHKFDKPQGVGRSLKNFPPAYSKQPKLKLGLTWDKPDRWDRGAAHGLLLFCGPENKSYRNRHDYAGPVEDYTTVQTLGIYGQHLMGFGKASTNWDEIVDGVRIGLDPMGNLNFQFVDAEGVERDREITVNGVALGGDTFVKAYKANDETQNNNSTLTSDGDLSLELDAATRYSIKGRLFVNCGNAASGFKFSLASDGSLTFAALKVAVIIRDSDSMAELGSGEITGTGTTSTSISGTGESGAVWVEFEGTVETGDTGALKHKWAQAVATAVDTKVLASSFSIAHKLGAA